MRLVLFLTLIFSSFICLAQAQNAIKFSIKDVNIVDKTLSVELTLKNHCDTIWVIHKPNIEALCKGVLRISLMDVDSEDKFNVHFCDEIYDIDSIGIGFYNAVGLNKNESFSCFLSIPLDRISPYLKRNRIYIVESKLLLENINFSSKLKRLFKKDLISNQFRVQF